MYRFLRIMALLGLPALAGTVIMRAQITEVPATVAPGKFLLEMDALSLTLDKEPGYKYSAFGAASTFLTTGLSANLDLQIGADFFIRQKEETNGITERRSGIGDLYVRTKWRFYEVNNFAVALLPYIKIPTNSQGVGNDSVEGGVIVPCSYNLPGGFAFAAMVELYLLRNFADNGYDTFWSASASLHRPLTNALGVYGEMALGKSSGGEPFESTLGLGVTFALSDRAWWDFAMYKGLSRGTADWNHVLRFNIEL